MASCFEFRGGIRARACFDRAPRRQRANQTDSFFSLPLRLCAIRLDLARKRSSDFVLHRHYEQAFRINTSRRRRTMSRLSFDSFFQAATGKLPYEYQRRLAGNDAGRPCESQLVSIPTGLGKCAAVVLAWLWNCVQLQNPKRRRFIGTQTD